MTAIDLDRDAVHRVLDKASGKPISVAEVIEELIRSGHTEDSAVAVVERLIASHDIVLTNTYALQPA